MNTFRMLQRILAGEFRDYKPRNVQSYVPQGAPMGWEPVETECELTVDGERYKIRIAKM